MGPSYLAGPCGPIVHHITGESTQLELANDASAIVTSHAAQHVQEE